MNSIFKDILKDPQESQMETEENSFDLSEIEYSKQKSFQIETIEENEDLDEFDLSQNVSFVENVPKKIQKRQRGNKKDDFDYNKFIRDELSQYKTQNMSKKEKKRLIQKIRNRKSAQRSRLRQKQAMNYLEYENTNLKNENKNLQQKVQILEQELKKQKVQIQKCKVEEPSCLSTKKYSESTENEMDSQKISQFHSPKYQRTGVQQQGFLQTKPILFMLGLIMIFCLFQHREPSYNNMVKIGGFSSMAPIKNKLDFRKRLQNMRKFRQERSKSKTDQEENVNEIKKIKKEVQKQNRVQHKNGIKTQSKRFKNLKKYVDNCLGDQAQKINYCEQDM